MICNLLSLILNLDVKKIFTDRTDNETDLFFRLLPSKTKDFKEKEYHGEQSQPRKIDYSFMLQCKRSENFQPIEIAKSQKP